MYVSLGGATGIETVIEDIKFISSKEGIDTFKVTTREYPPYDEGIEGKSTIKLKKEKDNKYVMYEEL